MENSDAFGSSTAPLTWHDFLERMRQPSAADFVKSIKSFIVTFSNNIPDPEKDSAAVQGFLASMEGAFRAHQLFAGCSEEELDSAGEGLEKYVMTKLYNRAFASLPEDVKHDELLYEKMALVQQFIKPENLDIKPDFQNDTALLLAQKELQKINMHKAPRDKLVCILNCCKVINNLLLNASIVSNDNPPGADEFLPVLIYVTIKANPPQLHSNLLYIQRYRRQSRLVSEAAYFFTNILSTESFIWNIDAKSLSMEEDEFEKNMESALVLLSGLSNNLDSVNSQMDQEVRDYKTEAVKTKKERNLSLPTQGSTKNTEFKEIDDKSDSVTTKPSISELENKGASDLLKEDEVSSSFLKYPYLYAQVGDLTLKDVEALLNSYKQLVLKYVSLAKGLGLRSQVGATEKEHEETSKSEKNEKGEAKDEKNEKGEITDEKNEKGEAKDEKIEKGEAKDEKNEKGEITDEKNEKGEAKDEKIEKGEAKDEKSEKGEAKDEKSEKGEAIDEKSEKGEAKDEKNEKGEAKDEKYEKGEAKDEKSEKGEAKDEKNEEYNMESSSSFTDNSESNPTAPGHETVKHSEEEVQSQLENTENMENTE
ncbi:hypothetical protein H6P81_011067 [Aristolochia fimbriata]|uniref:VPS9 domain-containing protein n=1 Tax=Aristolochia fimbriata TaxID=158543 RepID=A0AAV7EQH1_ARIFI|nr:hypothetical protein H6P81_011067 [Aristolochia fimbriata]